MTSNQSDRITINTADGTIELVFGEATPEQKAECFKQAGRTFVRGIPEDLWTNAEEQLDLLPLLQGKGCLHWCLYKAGTPKEIVSSLRAIRRELLIRDAQGVRPETSYDICFVATDEKYRGHGLASFLMRKVAEWFDGPGAVSLTTLYTAVGQFYVPFGWDLLPAPQVSFDLPPDVSRGILQRKREESPSLPTRVVGPHDVADLCSRDIAQLRPQVEAYDLAPDTSLVSTLPIPEQFEWYRGLAKLQSDSWCGGREIANVGAICDAADTWMLWHHDLRKKEFKISRVKPNYGDHEQTKQALVQLLLCAMEEAISWEATFEKVVIWDPNPEVIGALEILGRDMGFTPKSEMRVGTNHTSLRWAKDEKRQTVFWPNEYYAYN
ncbi:uncharacterized protein PG998_009521 [Apiospora kogelbergensis]|uniref:uncharacterized protein n=1 Tax=Apiospora kogelbergensis TaxID=1337665 RepID=UPI0031301A4F